MTAPRHTLYEIEGVEQDVFLLIADISGYTRFVTANQTTIIHSHLIINELLDTLITRLEAPVRVAKLEGDAVFLYALRNDFPVDAAGAQVGRKIVEFFHAFSQRLDELARGRICRCDACLSIERLRLKVLVHTGKALFSRVCGFDELFGLDVILIHRLLKNSVPASEYVLFTEAASREIELPNSPELTAGCEHYEDLGEVRTSVYFPEIAAMSLPSPDRKPTEMALGRNTLSPSLSQRSDIESEVRAPGAPNDAEREVRKISRRSFAWAGAALFGGLAGGSWLATRPTEDAVPWPLRRGLDVSERLWRDAFDGSRLAPTFPRSMAGVPRANGEEGLTDALNAAGWKLRVVGLHELPDGAESEEDERGQALLLGMDTIRALPRFEMVTELKCIEGWSQVVHWGGVRLADFIERYRPATRSEEAPDPRRRPEDLVEYVGLETPDRGYYVGIDMKSALHPQTMLCFEMNGAPLPEEHGAPLRLVIPVKYGVKNLKRIGRIEFTNRRPADYWAERGYDYYLGH